MKQGRLAGKVAIVTGAAPLCRKAQGRPRLQTNKRSLRVPHDEACHGECCRLIRSAGTTFCCGQRTSARAGERISPERRTAKPWPQKTTT
jgi:hypothetical protein